MYFFVIKNLGGASFFLSAPGLQSLNPALSLGRNEPTWRERGPIRRGLTAIIHDSRTQRFIVAYPHYMT